MKFLERKYFPFITLFFIVFIFRIPFLNAGYGVEEDSWGIALAAFHTKISGIYEPSRLPGHPVQELIYSVLWGAGPFIFNLLTAFFSSIGVVFFALILKHFQFRHFFIASLAFAFVPVYYISSTYTIDFVWAEALVLAGLFYLLKDKLIVCGILLGLAVGCRITSGAMLLPFLMIIWQKENFRQNLVHLLKLTVPMSMVAVIVFIPVIRQFGPSFFMYYDQFPYPSMAKVLYKMIPGVFGVLGTIAMGVCILWIIGGKNPDKGELFERPVNKKIIVACITVIVLYIVSYFRLPQKSGYMITVIPFVILLFGYYLNEKMFKIVCVSFIVSSFVFSINLTDKIRGATYSKYAVSFNVSGQELFFDPFSGPIFSDLSKREQKMKYTNEVIEKVKDVNEKTVIISGWWYNEIMVTMIPMEKNDLVVFEPYIDSVKINKYLSEGYKIKYLPEQNIYNDQMFRISNTSKLAVEF